MRHPLISCLAILAFAWSSAVPAGAGGQKKDINYRFESEPRAVLSDLGIGQSRDPKLALRPSGALYMLALCGSHAESQLGLFVSHDLGDSFAPPVPVSEKGKRVSSHGENSPSLAFGSTAIYALWEESLPEGGTDLMFARSITFGRNFEKPIRVTDKATRSMNGFSHLAVALDGTVYAVWLDGRDPEAGPQGTFSIYLAKSTDKGASFGKNVSVAGGACPCCRPQIALGSKGEVFVAWRHVFEGDIRDMVVAASLDNGETFSSPVRVAVDGWRIPGCPHSGPSLAVRDSRLYISWFSEGNGSNPGIRLSWSDDRAQTFARPVIASRKVVDANHPALSLSDDGRVLMVFKGRDPVNNGGWGPLRAYVIDLTDASADAQPILIPGSHKSIAYPIIFAATLGRVLVAWTEPGEKGANIFLSRGRRGTS